MSKQIFNRTKKILGILMIIFLVTSMTAMAVNAYDGMYDTEKENISKVVN
jgi:hypothetical protein